MLVEGATPRDEFAVEIGALTQSEMAEVRRMADLAVWRTPPGRVYHTADVTFWEPCSRAFFLRIPAKGHIPKHHDSFVGGVTHHLVLKTNPGCLNWWIDTQGTARSIHMHQGHKYRVTRDSLHWADNCGNADRIHLIVEYP